MGLFCYCVCSISEHRLAAVIPNHQLHVIIWIKMYKYGRRSFHVKPYSVLNATRVFFLRCPRVFVTVCVSLCIKVKFCFTDAPHILWFSVNVLACGYIAEL